mmetsp:Transcript_6808/g.18857  ORF Transcript_6808/g.18857 Transcript_6808/m.18857 type:complete len:275 (-) Transcript_6808:306-1130(-)
MATAVNLGMATVLRRLSYRGRPGSEHLDPLREQMLPLQPRLGIQRNPPMMMVITHAAVTSSVISTTAIIAAATPAATTSIFIVAPHPADPLLLQQHHPHLRLVLLLQPLLKRHPFPTRIPTCIPTLANPPQRRVQIHLLVPTPERLHLVKRVEHLKLTLGIQRPVFQRLHRVPLLLFLLFPLELVDFPARRLTRLEVPRRPGLDNVVCRLWIRLHAKLCRTVLALVVEPEYLHAQIVLVLHQLHPHVELAPLGHVVPARAAAHRHGKHRPDLLL